MTESRWQRVKAVLEQAQQQRPEHRDRWLDLHCDDADLRAEVEDLLAADEARGEALEQGPLIGPTRQLDDLDSEIPELQPQERLGPYRVDALIGRGGMGSVYRGYDERLQRPVALKLALDGGSGAARRRFQRELLALAKVSHANVLRIYDVVTAGARSVAVTELLEGESLRDRLESEGAVPWESAVTWIADAARGLSAVHAEGLVHRDLKPDNLFLTRSGSVKVLDFGIARPADDETGVPAITAPGALIGTPAYFAPEQARGEAGDPRTDLFALGSVLFELLTGTRPFPGATKLEIVERIRSGRGESLRALAPTLPIPVVEVVERLLAPDPDQRFQSASDLAWSLDRLRSSSLLSTDPPAATSFTTSPRARARPRGAVVAVLVAAVLGMAAGAILQRTLETEPPVPPRLTYLSSSDRDGAPDLSPDGRWLTFVSDRSGRSEIWLRDLTTGSERKLADGFGQPSFDPQSARVLFSADPGGSEGVSLYAVDLVSSVPTRLAADATVGAWSPDGRRLAFVREHRGAPRNRWDLYVVSTDGSPEVRVHSEPSPITDLLWSPDGASVWTAANRSQLGLGDTLLEIEIATGEVRELDVPYADGQLSRPAWSAEGRLVVAHRLSTSDSLAATRVLLMDPKRGNAETWFWVPGAVSGMDSAPDSERLVFDLLNRSQSLVVFGAGADSPPPAARGGRSRTIDRQPVFARTTGRDDAGTAVVFTSDRGSNLDLWRLDPSTGELARLTDHPAEDWDPDVSADGATLVWSSKRAGGVFEIFAADADGFSPRQITFERGPAENPTLTADGRSLVYSCGRPGFEGLRIVDLDGSNDRPIPRPPVERNLGRAHPEVSPDGRWVLFHDHLIEGVTHVRVAAIEDGRLTAFDATVRTEPGRPRPPVTLGRARWSPNGRAIAFLGLEAGAPVIEIQDFDSTRDTSASRRVLARGAEGAVPESFDLADDGRLVVSLLFRSSILVAADTDTDDS